MIDWNRPVQSSVGVPDWVGGAVIRNGSRLVRHADGEKIYHSNNGDVFASLDNTPSEFLDKYRLENVPATINWNLPLVADVGEPIEVDGPNEFGVYRVHHYNGNILWHKPSGETCENSIRYHGHHLRNRQWRVGDPVVAVENGIRGEVKGIRSGTEGNAFILVSFDGGCSSLVPANGIRYDYSRANKRTESTLEEALSVEALIADALQTHEESKRTGDDALADDIAAHLYSYRGNRDGPTMPVARSIIAMVREHDAAKPDADHFPDIKKMVSGGVEGDTAQDPDGPFPIRCNVAAIEMFAEERERAVAKARAEALEEAARIADEKHREQCGCWCVGTAIRALINKEPTND